MSKPGEIGWVVATPDTVTIFVRFSVVEHYNCILFFFPCQWCEEHRSCTDRLKLNDLLVKPMQRVTKYPLLLKAIYNKTLDDDMKEPINRMVRFE